MAENETETLARCTGDCDPETCEACCSPDEPERWCDGCMAAAQAERD